MKVCMVHIALEKLALCHYGECCRLEISRCCSESMLMKVSHCCHSDIDFT